jgi:hypothetical protein
MNGNNNNDSNDDGWQLRRRYKAICICELCNDGVQKNKNKKIFYFVFFLKIIFILFFIFSTDLVACSFDYLCKKLVEMEIEK